MIQQISEELKTLIHHILHRHKYYRLQIKQYHEALDILNQPHADDPRLIQHHTFIGIVTFNRNFKDQVAPALSNPSLQHISYEIKALLHKILHEFHFLNCIRAYQMFQERFRQPGLRSQQNNGQSLLFDDEIEKAKLHYMYYGPYSIYHVNPQKQQSFEGLKPPFINYQQSMFPDLYPFPKNSDLQNHYDELYRVGRTRPSRHKRKSQEKYSRMLYQPLRTLLIQHHGEAGILEERKDEYQNCPCRGFFESNQLLRCHRCFEHYHLKCWNSYASCMNCSMKYRDPFNQITETLSIKYFDWGEEKCFQQQINFKSCEKVCNTGRFEIMISCMRSDSSQITWPDGAIFSLNGENIFQIPPLLNDHQIKRRADAQIYITKQIFGRHALLDKTVLTLQVKNDEVDERFRNNNRGIFLFGVFLVQKKSIEDLKEMVLRQNSELPFVHPLQIISEDEDTEITSQTVPCFDPYTRQLINIPVRGASCRHITCFDLLTFLTFEAVSSQRLWHCPLCGLDAQMLIVDKFQQHVLEQIREMGKMPRRLVYNRGGKVDFEQAEKDSLSQENSHSH